MILGTTINWGNQQNIRTFQLSGLSFWSWNWSKINTASASVSKNIHLSPVLSIRTIPVLLSTNKKNFPAMGVNLSLTIITFSKFRFLSSLYISNPVKNIMARPRNIKKTTPSISICIVKQISNRKKDVDISNKMPNENKFSFCKIYFLWFY